MCYVNYFLNSDSHWLRFSSADESWTEPAFMKFLRATIETLPNGLSDELSKTAHIKSTKLKKKIETNLKIGLNLLT